ncbi:MAG: site-specific integrase [Lachnospiraceae bacterium]|nr:site-specific integrase [Lachnospiraceae bacterium]
MASRKDARGRVLGTGEYQRANGTYCYSYNDAIGKRRFLYAPDLVELREKEKKLKIKQWQGVDVERGNTTTINDTFDRYISTKYGLKDSTYASYIDMYDRYVREEFGKQLVKNIRYSDIQSLYTSMIKVRKVGIRTVEHIHMILHPVFEMAIRDDIIVKNPTKGIFADLKKLYGKTESKMHALSMDEQKKFLDYIDGHSVWGRYHSIFQVMLGTGMRVGELCALRWEDVDFEKRVISVNQSVVYVRAHGGKRRYLHVSTPKTAAGKRTIPIMEAVMNGFKEEYMIAESKGFQTCEIDGYKDFVFTKKTGRVYSSERLDKALSDIIRSYNAQEEAIAKEESREPVYLPHFSCHVLRHTFCTRLCERDVNLKVIQTVMGHANIKITMDIYAEVSEEKQRMEIEKMADELDVF